MYSNCSRSSHILLIQIQLVKVDSKISSKSSNFPVTVTNFNVNIKLYNYISMEFVLNLVGLLYFQSYIEIKI